MSKKNEDEATNQSATAPIDQATLSQSIAVALASLLQPKTPEAVQEPDRKLDATVKGGKYFVNGVYVDANGNPIKE